jgi:hypothetical protein
MGRSTAKEFGACTFTSKIQSPSAASLAFRVPKLLNSQVQPPSAILHSAWQPNRSQYHQLGSQELSVQWVRNKKTEPKQSTAKFMKPASLTRRKFSRKKIAPMLAAEIRKLFGAADGRGPQRGT